MKQIFHSKFECKFMICLYTYFRSVAYQNGMVRPDVAEERKALDTEVNCEYIE